ncbi:MAG: stage III sporulation protein SpoIIIAB [Desulfitobacteriaceae bacterium]|nr:stage III sporulation protein SpoIIIAB [Desulfitobacteriaceae bacterium]MDD4752333.1 stage III sporulation protein SpoIIIAB [Desulfitobacteriaceae bacterium]
MLKLLGAFLIIIPCGLIGLRLGRNLSRRAEELRQLQFALQSLETEIVFAATPLPDAMKSVAGQINGEISEVFNQTATELVNGQGQTAAEAWHNSLKEKESSLVLNKSDMAILEQFGQGLGISDREDQKKRLTMARMQLVGREKQAESERRQFQKLWQSLGWMMGFLITLLLI